MPPNAAIGNQATSEASSRNAIREKTPSITPERRVQAPLDRFTIDAPICPAPGMPPSRAEPMLPKPWPISSRFEL